MIYSHIQLTFSPPFTFSTYFSILFRKEEEENTKFIDRIHQPTEAGRPALKKRSIVIFALSPSPWPSERKTEKKNISLFLANHHMIMIILKGWKNLCPPPLQCRNDV